MSEGPNPTSWHTFAPWGIWGGLIFSCLMVFVEDLVDGKPYQALSALGLGLVTAAMAIHWKAISPKFGVPIVILLLVVIIMSPYVEQKRIPYAWLFRETNGNETQEIASTVIAGLKPILGTTGQPLAPISAHDVAAEVIRSLPSPQQGQASAVSVAATANAIARVLSSQHSLISLQDYEGMKAQLNVLSQENERLKRAAVNTADDSPTPMLGLTNERRWKIVTTFTDATMRFLSTTQRCHMLIEENAASSSATQFWSEINQVFKYAGWQLEGFNSRTVFPKGVLINVSSNQGLAFSCGWQLHELLESLNVTPLNFQANQTTPALVYCAQCVNVVLSDVSIQ